MLSGDFIQTNKKNIITSPTIWLIEAWWRIFALTHWGRDNMAAISQTTHSNAFKRIENVIIWIKISLKFVPKGPINNIPALVQIRAWRLPGDKPLSEAMMASLLMHICVTRSQWVNENGHHWFKFWLFTCSVPNHTNYDYQLNIWVHIFEKFDLGYKHFLRRKCILNCHLQNVGHFVQASVS